MQFELSIAFNRAINSLMSLTFQIDMLSPIFFGFGNKPELTPAHQVVFETGITGGTGGEADLSPSI